jgi:hypothetical protein
MPRAITMALASPPLALMVAWCPHQAATLTARQVLAAPVAGAAARGRDSAPTAAAGPQLSAARRRTPPLAFSLTMTSTQEAEQQEGSREPSL